MGNVWLKGLLNRYSQNLYITIILLCRLKFELDYLKKHLSVSMRVNTAQAFAKNGTLLPSGPPRGRGRAVGATCPGPPTY